MKKTTIWLLSTLIISGCATAYDTQKSPCFASKRVADPQVSVDNGQDVSRHVADCERKPININVATL